jgi:hypothetical protein
MTTQHFAIVPSNDGWGIELNGELGGDYLTREAAFEAVVGDASNALRNGDKVEIIVDVPPADRSGSQ